VGGLDEKVTEALMWELFVQSGPVGKYYFSIVNVLQYENPVFNTVLNYSAALNRILLRYWASVIRHCTFAAFGVENRLRERTAVHRRVKICIPGSVIKKYPLIVNCQIIGCK
jgi:hypothetical protein